MIPRLSYDKYIWYMKDEYMRISVYSFGGKFPDREILLIWVMFIPLLFYPYLHK